ncbi:MAG: NERD domain-containing protein [Oscillospiraceae bacterium]|nr:NERD domain-containing protein [Oscillospiraceae bacterium]
MESVFYYVFILIINLIVFLPFIIIGILAIISNNTPNNKIITSIRKQTINERRGDIGEWLTYNVLLSPQVLGSRKILRNLYIPMNKGHFTEIDIVMIHESFIFVVENKSYSGWIYGCEDATHWTQTFKSGRRYHFYNPMKQNNTHVYALSKYLNMPVNNIFSIIVFGEGCTLKQIPSSSRTPTIILNRHELAVVLNNIISSSETRFTLENIDEIYNALLPLSLTDEKTLENHVERINSINN